MPKKHEPYELVKKLNFKASQNHSHTSRCVVHIYLNEAATVVISTSSSCYNSLDGIWKTTAVLFGSFSETTRNNHVNFTCSEGNNS
ncbi:unnamed protein product [Tenebrio molitor]|nr:unnamed protein product [Tenebrio molitor]